MVKPLSDGDAEMGGNESGGESGLWNAEDLEFLAKRDADTYVSSLDAFIGMLGYPWL